MKNIGSTLFVLGVLAIVLNYLDRVPRLLMWIYNWGETTAWAIKIGITLLGAILYFIGSKKEQNSTDA
jgi:hypothetical protein